MRRASASDVADRPPGIFQDHDLVGRKTTRLEEMARSMRQNGTRGRRVRAASQPGSQHVDLAAWRGRVEAVLDQPAVAHDKITAMGYGGSERTTRRAVAQLKASWHAGRRRVHRPWTC